MNESQGKRFRDRHLELFDLVGRFEAVPWSTHSLSARAVIERLRQEGDTLWTDDPAQLTRWRHYCDVLRTLVATDLGNRRFLQKRTLEAALRDFIVEFEHSGHRMFQMLYGASETPQGDPYIRSMLSWLEMVYRLSTYAIISFWTDEKWEEKSTTVKIDLTSGEYPKTRIEETVVHKKMPKPKDPKHRLGMRKL